MANKTISILGCGWLGLPLAQHLIERSFTVNGSTTTADKCAQLKTSKDRDVKMSNSIYF